MNEDVSRNSIRRGLIFILLAAFSWSLLSLWLASDGHRPSGPSLFDEQYKSQAILIVPILLFCWIVFTGLLWRFLAKDAKLSECFGPLGQTLGSGYLLCWILPDVLIYGLFGFQTLGSVAPFLPILTTLYVVFFAARFVSRKGGAGLFKVTSIVIAAWIAQAIPVLVFVR